MLRKRAHEISQAATNEIIKQMTLHTSNVDRILSRSEFLNRFSSVLNPAAPLTKNDLDVLLVHLARDKQAISYDAQTIKFKSENESLPSPILQEDTAIATLRDTLAKFSAQLAPLEEKVASADATAREAVKLKQMARAKGALRSKKMAESALAQRAAVVEQLEGIFDRLQQAADQVEIVEAMKASSLALKSLNSKVGGAEGVSNVVDDLRKEMDATDEITSIINESRDQVDELEIDDEFEALENAEKEKAKRREAAEREKREQEEALATAARLAEIAKPSHTLTENAKGHLSKPVSDGRLVDQASESFANLSFVEKPQDEDAAEKKEKEKVRVPA